MRSRPPGQYVKVDPANDAPCAQCPWRTTNQGKRHPDGWYTKANRDRLWAQLRRGESMTCHPTDAQNPVPAGTRAVPVHVIPRECAGAIILQQREFQTVQDDYGADVAAYRRARPRGLTREGILTIVNRVVFGGVNIPALGLSRVAMTRPNLNEDVSHEPLGTWTQR